MNKIQKLKEIIKFNNSINLKDEILKLFHEQIEETTIGMHLILTNEEYETLDTLDFDFFDMLDDTFDDCIFVSVEETGEIDFVHYCRIEDIDSIKNNGLLVSYSGKGTYVPDMGHGIYAIESDNAYDATDEIAEYLLEKYYRENAEVGYVVGRYNGRYLTCVHGYRHEGYIALKEDVTLDMIKNIDSEYISGLAEDYYEYITEFEF